LVEEALVLEVLAEAVVVLVGQILLTEITELAAAPPQQAKVIMAVVQAGQLMQAVAAEVPAALELLEL
jgi:hypothetical protein